MTRGEEGEVMVAILAMHPRGIDGRCYMMIVSVGEVGAEQSTSQGVWDGECPRERGMDKATRMQLG